MGDLTVFPVEGIVVDSGERVSVMPLVMIRRIMSGQMSIAECDNPEAVARALATLAIEYLEMDNGAAR